MHITASRTSRRRRNFGDIPRTFVLLVWVGFACSIFFYVFDRSSSPPDVAVKPQSYAAGSQANNAKEADDDKLYTGSIVLVEPDRCWVRTMDNRTGSMWDIGYVKCDNVVASLAQNSPHGTTSVQRINSIGQAFRGKGD
jgi:hypothetical protein